jgi:hypothetical protein
MQLTAASQSLNATQPADTGNPSPLGGAILMAALALPGLIDAAHADTPPEQGAISLKYLDYHDWQPGLDRIAVSSPSIGVQTPIADVWSLQGSVVSDSISGASPRYHTAISGASTMRDHRVAEDLSVSRYFPQGSLNAAVAHSGEDDYQSRSISIGGSASTADKNTTANFGLGVTNDTINPVNLIVVDAKKHTLELMAGVTQILTQRDIVQLDITHVAEQGYLSDPYKYVDNRPDERSQNILLLRWNHHLDSSGGTSRFSYRYYSDTYQIRAHTFGLEYVQPMPHGWIMTPSARIYTQTAAGFYVNPVYDPTFGPPFPPGYVFGSAAYITEDQRLSAFGAYTLGLKVEKQLTRDLRVDVKLENYAQRGSWALFGNANRDLAPYYARIIQVGLSKQW